MSLLSVEQYKSSEFVSACQKLTIGKTS